MSEAAQILQLQADVATLASESAAVFGAYGNSNTNLW